MNSDVSATNIVKVYANSRDKEKSIIKDLEIDMRRFMTKIYKEMEMELKNYKHVD
jgi:hypothetical protein